MRRGVAGGIIAWRLTGIIGWRSSGDLLYFCVTRRRFMRTGASYVPSGGMTAGVNGVVAILGVAAYVRRSEKLYCQYS